jgi:hypothetical protein
MEEGRLSKFIDERNREKERARQGLSMRMRDEVGD